MAKAVKLVDGNGRIRYQPETDTGARLYYDANFEPRHWGAGTRPVVYRFAFSACVKALEEEYNRKSQEWEEVD